MKKKRPALRFSGFDNDWEQRKLNELVTYHSSNLTASDARDVGKFDLYDANSVIGKTNIEPMNSEYITIIKDGAGVGRIRTMPQNTMFIGTMGGLQVNKSDINFIFSLLTRFDLGKEYSGSTIPHIYFKDYGNNDYYVPAKDEQQAIGQYFTNLDHLITLHQCKCKKLICIKKSMLENMFPQKDEKIPRIRFSGFTDAWEQRKLGNVADLVGGGTPSTQNPEYWDGDIDWYAPAEIANQIYVKTSQRKITEQGYDNSSAKLLPLGTVLFTSRAGIGKTAILARKGCTNQGFQSIVPHKNELDTYFIFSRTEELKRYGELVGAGSTFVEVSGKQMAAMDLMLPSTIQEQQMIGVFFKQLDHLITLHQRKLKKLQNIRISARARALCVA